MKIGLQINRFDYPGDSAAIGPALAKIATAAETAGFDSLWVMDHFFQIGFLGPVTDPMLEAYTTLGFLAGVTSKVTLGTLVTGVIYRQPALLIKAATALDVLSGGRAYLGIGAGWFEEEAESLGFLNPLTSRRFDRLEDTLRLAKQMWAGDERPFKGKIYDVPRPLSRPQPVQKPHPPIMIGGGGEARTLRLVAQYGDACNLFASADVKHKLDVLKRHCSEVGREYDQIEKSVTMGMNVAMAGEDEEKVMERAKALADLGVSHVIFSVPKDVDPKVYEEFTGLAERLHRL